ncbi:MAG: hypothetical protein ACRBDL_07065 [Alphaproteobacteria bacterium]
MAESPLSVKLVKAGILLLDTVNASIVKVVPLQYNPETLTRSLQVRGGGSEGGAQGDARRLSGPPVESYTVEAIWDATDRVTAQSTNDSVIGDLSVFETILYPESQNMMDNHELAGLGAWNIIPVQKPLTVFSWGNNRVMPVRITSFSVTEDAFDNALNPVRARISLGMQVLTVDELGHDSIGGTLYMAYQKQKEGLANAQLNGALDALGLQGNEILSAIA